MKLEVAKIAELHVYPIKSCAGVRLQEARLTALGLEHDRFFMVVDAVTGAFLSQRECPRLCLVQPEIGQSALSLSAPQMPVITVSLDCRSDERCVVGIWDELCSGWDAGDLAAGWFSQFLDRQCRLIAYGDRTRQSSYFKKEIPVSFADGYPLLGVSRESLRYINSRITAGGGRAVPMNRFRPNIVFELGSNGRPYEEESINWDALFIGNRDVFLKPGPVCFRCALTLIDQETGCRDSKGEPLRTIARFRQAPNGIVFGRYFMGKSNEGEDPAVLRVGDAVKL
ncbi:MAG: hypothetical protein A3H64_02575 [Candidatus Ryanbacteria bacterium RIFCSPLOWO2_02_FULL_45_11c]|uniref:MOSC domain-containing protein n=1 Tax=Candidatus Ryanbacteria bacterium RIFCSPLOWO2_02_FULL_45_11c TaxID=1802128 RepID=A0A1G2GYE7_9BACT|nr:MAG: hypothetical protein A3H64_02575 [Candidatus Ryanbacteria bacterium RIFCSPLOWO2_02_FULL_45_11c]